MKLFFHPTSAFISQGGAKSVGEVFTCEYFTVRTYKKGSAHVTFTRPHSANREKTR
ncbi:DUF4942 domain-containing protein [Klebsiella quasipneumoniae]|uniref:DUF4942 domain-containing protein n=1 Tax=Klebsiella quasipneumoniae TaxID=1463165 RepID=UPI00387A7B12